MRGCRIELLAMCVLVLCCCEADDGPEPPPPDPELVTEEPMDIDDVNSRGCAVTVDKDHQCSCFAKVGETSDQCRGTIDAGDKRVFCSGPFGRD